MLDFMRIFCLVGLPVFAAAALYLWRPAGRRKESKGSVALQIAWTVVVLVLSVALWFPILFLPFVLAAIWKPDWRPNTTADRIAWTIFAFGICLMLAMVLYTMTREGDGDWRAWETIRLHSRVFLAISMIPILGPLIVYLVQAARARRGPAVAKKAAVDDWEAAPPLG